MKNLKLILPILLIIFSHSCKKEIEKQEELQEEKKEELQKEEKKDFRTPFIGKYQVNEHIYSYGPPQCVPYINSTKDTIISVQAGATDSSLIVLGREVILDANNEFYDYHYGLQFRNDSIFSNYMNGGLGCGQYEIYKGKKISENP